MAKIKIRKKRNSGTPGVQIILNEVQIPGTLKLNPKLKDKERVYATMLFRSTCPLCGEPVELTRQMSDHGMSIDHKCQCNQCNHELIWAELKDVQRVKPEKKKPMARAHEFVSPPTLF